MQNNIIDLSRKTSWEDNVEVNVLMSKWREFVKGKWYISVQLWEFQHCISTLKLLCLQDEQMLNPINKNSQN